MKELSRRGALAALSGLSFAAAPLPAAAVTRSRMRSVDGRGKVIWQNRGRFTKNPDIVQFPSGKLMLTFADTDRHWSEEISRVTTLESADGGATWENPRVIAEADRRKGEERWVTPRLSCLRDGTAILVCDHDDYAHTHEDHPLGIWAWTSRDEGRTWSEGRLLGVPGFEPDRVVQLDNGTLIVASQYTFRSNRKLAVFTMRSVDRGKTWKDMSVVAKDAVHNFCEGAIVTMKGGEMACLLRENNHAGYPSYVSFSADSGKNWGKPQPLPFAGDRPYAKQLADGRVLVTYRNVAGNRGTHAWIGDLRKEAGYRVAGTHYADKVTLESGELRVHDMPGADNRYTLMPPENFWSNVYFEMSLRVNGPADQSVAVVEIGRLGVRLEVCGNALWLHRGSGQGRQPTSFPTGVPRSDQIHRVDVTKLTKIRLQAIGGRLEIAVDGKRVLHWVILAETPLRETHFGRLARATGEVAFSRVEYPVSNQTEPAFTWDWSAASGKLPDQYQIDRMLELHANPPTNPDYPPDNGYSSWLERKDGSIYLVDYSNRGDSKPSSHLYSVTFDPADFQS